MNSYKFEMLVSFCMTLRRIDILYLDECSQLITDLNEYWAIELQVKDYNLKRNKWNTGNL